MIFDVLFPCAINVEKSRRNTFDILWRFLTVFSLSAGPFCGLLMLETECLHEFGHVEGTIDPIQFKMGFKRDL